MVSVYLVPAYGRDYTTIKSVLIDFNRNWSFISNTYGWPDKPVDRQTLIALGIPEVKIRYANKTKWVFVDVKTGRRSR